jgi:hypothetical protein
MIFPLDQLPYDAYVKLLDTHKSYLKEFEPTNLEDDLRTGMANAMVYWYPVYAPMLYELASKKVHYKDFFDQYSFLDYWLFTDIFSDTAKKLDKLLSKSLNETILGETKIINGKLK